MQQTKNYTCAELLPAVKGLRFYSVFNAPVTTLVTRTMTGFLNLSSGREYRLNKGTSAIYTMFIYKSYIKGSKHFNQSAYNIMENNNKATHSVTRKYLI